MQKIVSVTELIQAIVSILLQRPDDARRRPSDYLTDDNYYETVFGVDKYPLNIYLKCVQIMRRVQQFIQPLKDIDRTEKQNFKFYVAMLLVCDLTNRATPTTEHLEQISVTQISDSDLSACLKKVQIISKTDAENGEGLKGAELLSKLQEYIHKKFKAKKFEK